PAHAHKRVVVGHPPPTLYASAAPVRPVLTGGRLRLFYPSAAYDHKNHALLRRLGELDVIDRITVTLERDEVDGLDGPMFRSVGRLSELECLFEYRRSHALLFVSRLESFGLPLVEAMSLGLPIICPDLPYARNLCGDQAVYFADDDADSLGRAIVSLHRRLVSGWYPQWQDRLARLPRDWAAVADRLVAVSLGHRPGLHTG
ncbi:MAG TPA: glycosyltransferase, partial [Burkholderiaceae bacterium]|nr:glycosyltransferase [Burkholderiaceae bacterium]